MGLWNVIKNLFHKKLEPIIPDQHIPPPVPVKSRYLWNNPHNSENSVIAICNEMGLTPWNRNILVACVHVESNFNPKAIHHNKDQDGRTTSIDYGICQINSFFQIGKGKPFPSSEYVLQNPAECIRWMCKMFLAGKMDLWSSYKSKAYQKYLYKNA